MARTAIVIGGGIGGLGAARALARTGWDVAVYEQAPVIHPVGAGIGIAPNAMKALHWLGLADQLRVRGARQVGMEIMLRSGRRVAHLPAADIETRFGDPFIALHRAELHRILLESLDGVDLHPGHRATGVTVGADSASVEIQGPSGRLAVAADLVVAADGVRSPLRAALFPDYGGPTYAGYTV